MLVIRPPTFLSGRSLHSSPSPHCQSWWRLSLPSAKVIKSPLKYLPPTLKFSRCCQSSPNINLAMTFSVALRTKFKLFRMVSETLWDLASTTCLAWSWDTPHSRSQNSTSQCHNHPTHSQVSDEPPTSSSCYNHYFYFSVFTLNANPYVDLLRLKAWYKYNFSLLFQLTPSVFLYYCIASVINLMTTTQTHNLLNHFLFVGPLGGFQLFGTIINVTAVNIFLHMAFMSF